jgi:ribosomal protein S18 acetylase RimI-like enzyme
VVTRQAAGGPAPRTLPEGLSIRAPAAADLAGIVRLIRECELAEHGEAEAEADDLLGDWQRSGFDPDRDAWLVAGPEGDIAGYADVWARDEFRQFNCAGYVHPRRCGSGIGRRLLQLMEERARELMAGAPSDGRAALNNIVSHTNERARRLLEEEGYGPVRYYWRMVIQMEEPPPPPQWPQGITVRSFARGRDERPVYAAVQEAFADNKGFVPTSFEDWSNFMIERETFDPALWFLAIDGDEVAGVALCPSYPGNGWVRQVAVRRRWRRRGIALALLRQAFGEFYRRGKREVGLVVDSYNLSGARDLYERAGMRLERQHDAYEKEIRPARRR